MKHNQAQREDNGCVYIQAERMAKKSVEAGLITRFQVAEYLKEYYQQRTGESLGDRFDPDQPKDFFRRWNGAKKANIKAFKKSQQQRAQAVAHLSDKMPIELLIAAELSRSTF